MKTVLISILLMMPLVGTSQTNTNTGETIIRLSDNYGVGTSGNVYHYPNPPRQRSSTPNYGTPTNDIALPKGTRRGPSYDTSLPPARYVPPKGFARDLKAKPIENSICYCGRTGLKGACVMRRVGEKGFLEMVHGDCSNVACTVSLNWSLKKICKGRWRPFIINTIKPRLDDDGDGVPNFYDRCPRSPAGEKVRKIGKRTGCSDKDRYYLTNY